MLPVYYSPSTKGPTNLSLVLGSKYVHIDTRVGTVQYTCMAKPDVDQVMSRQMDSVYGELLCGCGRYYNGSAVTVL